VFAVSTFFAIKTTLPVKWIVKRLRGIRREKKERGGKKERKRNSNQLGIAESGSSSFREVVVEVAR